MNIRIFNKIICLTVASISIISITGCTSFDHWARKNYKWGDISEINQKEIIFCAGNQYSVRIGEILNVYKSIKAHSGFTRRYKKITMGVIQITGFVDELNAKAIILYGAIDKECYVEI